MGYRQNRFENVKFIGETKKKDGLFSSVLKFQIIICVIVYILVKGLELVFPNKFGNINLQLKSFLADFSYSSSGFDYGKNEDSSENLVFHEGEKGEGFLNCGAEKSSNFEQDDSNSKITVGVEGEDPSHDDCGDVTCFNFRPPLLGKVGSSFGQRENPLPGKKGEEFHYGVDIFAKDGTPIGAIYDGVVSKITSSKKSGNCLTIKHDQGFESIYAHCEKILVKLGDTVKVGQNVANSGHTGNVTGPHLHLGIRKDGKWINPIDCFPLLKKT